MSQSDTSRRNMTVAPAHMVRRIQLALQGFASATLAESGCNKHCAPREVQTPSLLTEAPPSAVAGWSGRMDGRRAGASRATTGRPDARIQSSRLPMHDAPCDTSRTALRKRASQCGHTQTIRGALDPHPAPTRARASEKSADTDNRPSQLPPGTHKGSSTKAASAPTKAAGPSPGTYATAPDV